MLLGMLKALVRDAVSSTTHRVRRRVTSGGDAGEASARAMGATRLAVSTRLKEAMDRHHAGDIGAAGVGYNEVLALDPTNFDALHLLGVIAMQRGDSQEAVRLIEAALQREPAAYTALHNLGLAYQAMGNVEQALASFGRAVTAGPDYIPAHESHARVLHEQGRLEETAVEFSHIARLTPDSPAAHCNLGTVLGQLGRFSGALECYERALAIDPLHQDTLLNGAQVLAKLGRTEEAVQWYMTLLDQRPVQAISYYRAGALYYSVGMRAEARQAFGAALAMDGDCVEARWALAMCELPLAYGLNEVPSEFRARFENALIDLENWFTAGRASLGYRAVGNQTPFYLAFHEDDNRQILARYGELCAGLMQVWRSDKPPLSDHRSHTPVRLGVASGFFYDQSVWTALLRGWCTQFDRDRIELHLFHTGSVSDQQTASARSLAASFCASLVGLAEWVNAIEARELDALLYPEIGMDATCVKLASLRLAPVQIAAWGHPETTGLPTVDYFLSAALFEPEGSSRHYGEQLVQLPNLGCYYEPLAPPPVQPDWHALGIESGVPILACPGTPYKYLPSYDDILVQIAKRLGRCQFLFFVDMAPRLSRQIEARLTQAFAEAGICARDCIRFLPRQSRPEFFGLLRGCDVYLDTIGFSGFNTAMQAVECGVPVVTCNGRFMRGRLASGVLKRMELHELVAADARGYVDLAVRLCEDAPYRASIARRIAERQVTLWRDVTPVRALEDFLCAVTRDGMTESARHR